MHACEPTAGINAVTTLSANGPNVHLSSEKLPYLALEEEMEWSADNHTVSIHD